MFRTFDSNLPQVVFKSLAKYFDTPEMVCCHKYSTENDIKKQNFIKLNARPEHLFDDSSRLVGTSAPDVCCDRKYVPIPRVFLQTVGWVCIDMSMLNPKRKNFKGKILAMDHNKGATFYLGRGGGAQAHVAQVLGARLPCGVQGVKSILLGNASSRFRSSLWVVAPRFMSRERPKPPHPF